MNDKSNNKMVKAIFIYSLLLLFLFGYTFLLMQSMLKIISQKKTFLFIFNNIHFFSRKRNEEKSKNQTAKN